MAMYNDIRTEAPNYTQWHSGLQMMKMQILIWLIVCAHSLEGSGGQTGYSASPSDVASFMSMGNTATAVLETPETIVEETVVEGNSDVSAEESSDVINDASTQNLM